MRRLPDPRELTIPPTGNPDTDAAIAKLADFVRDMAEVQRLNNSQLSQARNPTQYSVQNLPSASPSQAGSGPIWVKDATGGPVLCYTRGDGIWRRVDNNLQVT